MTDQERSRNMAAIHGKDTKPEVYLRKLLYHRGYRYRKNWSKVRGKPDIFILRYNVAVFVHGCFWHAHHGCPSFRMPATRVEYWKEKFRRNQKRDQEVLEGLSADGVRAVVVWECAVDRMRSEDAFREVVLDSLDAFFHSARPFLELEARLES